MKKMKRYNGEEESEVSYVDEDSPESQKVYSSKLTELSDEERMPRRAASSPAPKKAAPKAAAKPVAATKKASTDYASAARAKYAEARGYDEASKNKNLSGEDRRAMLGRHAQAMKDYDTLGRASKFAESKGMKKGGSVASASRRADGIAQRGKTRGKLV
jgi:hypothetical protein